MNTVNIRYANITDLSNIATLHAESWREHYDRVLTADYLNNKVYSERTAVWSSRLNTPPDNQLVLVVEEANEFCGFICAYGGNHPHYGTVIDNLHISPAYKGKGLGTRLLNEVSNWAREFYPQNGLYLEVLACNPKAIGFYQSLGAILLKDNYWTAPCGSKVKEYLYGWHEPELASK